GVNWGEITLRLAKSRPLALATNLPPDVASALTARPGYAELFQRAFGDGTITADRIAKAIATYERTLIADQTPFDLGTLTPNQQAGLQRMGPQPPAPPQGGQPGQPAGDQCIACHVPPMFTDQSFRNIGLR